MDIVVFGSVTARLPRTPSTRPQRASCATSTTTTPSRAGALRRSRAGSTSKGVATRKAGARWGRSTVRQMLRNPTYRGTACFGKTRIVRGVARRKRVTRKLQQSDLGHLGIRDRLMSEADQTAFTQKACCPPARLRCAAVGLASTDLERSRGMVQHRASAAGVGRPAAVCGVVRMPLRTTEAGDRSPLHRHVASPGRLDGRPETSLLENRPGSNRRFVPSRTSRPDRGIAFRAMVGRQARPPASSSSDIMPAAQPAIDVHHGHDAFYDVQPRPGAGTRRRFFGPAAGRPVA